MEPPLYLPEAMSDFDGSYNEVPARINLGNLGTVYAAAVKNTISWPYAVGTACWFWRTHANHPRKFAWSGSMLVSLTTTACLD